MNKRKLFLCLFLICNVFTVYGQKEIWNIKSNKHQQIKGTKYFIIPPEGFIESTRFQGYQQSNSGASIIFFELPGPFSETTKGFTEQGLKSQGLKMNIKTTIKVNGTQGLYLSTEQFFQGTEYNKYILAFGDDKGTIMLTGMFPKSREEISAEIKESLCSVVYDSITFTDPENEVPFKVNTEDTKLKFAKNITSTLLYTVDGKVPTESTDKTTFMVGQSLASIQLIDKKLNAINRLKKMPYDNLLINENQITDIEIDGISGYAILAKGENEAGFNEFIYQVMLYTDTGYYLMVGIVADDNEHESNLDLIKKITLTFRRK